MRIRFTKDRELVVSGGALREGFNSVRRALGQDVPRGPELPVFELQRTTETTVPPRRDPPTHGGPQPLRPPTAPLVTPQEFTQWNQALDAALEAASAPTADELAAQAKAQKAHQDTLDKLSSLTPIDWPSAPVVKLTPQVPVSPARQLRERESAAKEIQALWRGHLQRKEVQVRTIGDGLVHVQIRGGAELLAKLGVPGIHTPEPKSIDYVAIDPAKYTAQLAGDGSSYHAKSKPAAQTVQTLLGGKPQAEADWHVVVNAMFFNMLQRTSFQHPEASTIGEAIIPGATLPPHLPVPAGYEDSFLTHRFSDGSMMTIGPELCRDGAVSFGPERLQEERFQWKGDAGFRPGMLSHANHPNPRVVLVLPGEPGGDAPQPSPAQMDRIRAAIVIKAPGLTGANANGLDFPEAAQLANRLAQLNETPGGQGIALDGGQSAMLLALKKDADGTRTKVLELAQSKGARSPTYIVFSHKPEEPAQE